MKPWVYPLALTVALLLASCASDDEVPSGSGLIEATEVTISAEVSGKITSLFIEEGEDVAIGDALALIDTVTITLRLEQAVAARQAAETKVKMSAIGIEQAGFNYELAKKEYERVSTLIKSGSINQQLFDQTENAYNQALLTRRQAAASYEAAKAELESRTAEINLLQKQKADCLPLAPVSGTVLKKYVETGEFISVGRPLVKVAKLDTVWVKIYLPPSDLTKLSLGGHASVDPEDGSGQLLEGAVTWISDQAEFTPKNVQTKEARAGLIYAVKVTIPNPERRLKVGMPVMVTVQ